MRNLERALAREAPREDADAVAAAASRLTERAAETGVADVAYTTASTPLGELLVAATPRGLVRVSYLDAGQESELERLAARVSPRVVEAPGVLDGPRRQLEEYFEGRRRDFDLPLDWAMTAGFGRRVLRATARIPYGDTSTYRQVAGHAGNALAVRAAGNALGANPMPIVVPCHRVLRTGGGLGGYTGGLQRKEFLLELEGAEAG
jgi:methylated-DNA-[protein]-cysteine S-methyltransferase